MIDDTRLFWSCRNCDNVLSAYGQSTLEILIRAHLKVHELDAERKARSEPWNSPATVIANKYVYKKEEIEKGPVEQKIQPPFEETFLTRLTAYDKKLLRGMLIQW